MNKRILSTILRKLGLLRFTDKIRFIFVFLSTTIERIRFKQRNPSIKLPPSYFLYETYKLDYQSYLYKGRESARQILSLLEKYKSPESLVILDWGCGPGRITRHLPSLLEDSCKLYGTDPNKKYVAWCKKNIPGIEFSVNDLAPPMHKFDSNFFDFIYGISIFTHMSGNMHFLWNEEIMRILKPGGIFLFTTQGESFIEKLSNQERTLFHEGKIIEKSNTKEGHRTYSSFQPTAFIKSMVKNHEILENIPGKKYSGEQDIWIIKKVAPNILFSNKLD